MINKALVAIFHLEDNLMPFIVPVHMTLSNSHSAIENSFVSLKKILLHAEDQSHVHNSGSDEKLFAHRWLFSIAISCSAAEAVTEE